MLSVNRDVVVFIHYYFPGYESGGPARSVANIAERLGAEFNFHIVTLGHDLIDKTPYADVVFDTWNVVGAAKVWYMSSAVCGPFLLWRALRKLDDPVLYLNSLFDPGFSLLPLVLMKFGLLGRGAAIVAPRGELSPGALELKAGKKQCFLILARFLGLHRKVLWHASTEMEFADIRTNFFSQVSEKSNNDAFLNTLPICIASDLVIATSSVPAERITNDVVFLSRISRKKNLDYALRVLSKCSENVRFHIYGTIEDELYWDECRRLIADLPAHINVVFHGALSPSAVSATLGQHSLFFFPTRGENYGHVIAEALAAGLPVLLSDQTPWGDVTLAGAGWVMNLADMDAFARVIDTFVILPLDERKAIAAAVQRYATNRLGRPEEIEDTRKLFSRAFER